MLSSSKSHTKAVTFFSFENTIKNNTLVNLKEENAKTKNSWQQRTVEKKKKKCKVDNLARDIENKKKRWGLKMRKTYNAPPQGICVAFKIGFAVVSFYVFFCQINEITAEYQS